LTVNNLHCSGKKYLGQGVKGVKKRDKKGGVNEENQ